MYKADFFWSESVLRGNPGQASIETPFASLGNSILASRAGICSAAPGNTVGPSAIQGEILPIRCNSKAVRINALIPTETNGSLLRGSLLPAGRAGIMGVSDPQPPEKTTG